MSLVRIILACMSILAQNLADDGNFAVYMMLLVAALPKEAP